MHASGRVCKRQNRRNKAILYKRICLEKSNKLYKMSFLLSTFYIALIRCSYRRWLQECALVPRPFWPNFRGKVVLSNDHVLVRIELRGAIVELAPKSKVAPGYWSCEHYVKFLTFIVTSTQS